MKTRPCRRLEREASPQAKVAVSLCRDDSRVTADLDWHLKAPMDHKVNGNAAFFSAGEVRVCFRSAFDHPIPLILGSSKGCDFGEFLR